MVLFLSCANLLFAEDWPMWRADSGRTGHIAEALPEKLSVRWSRHLPPLEPAYRHHRLQFDGGYEPIVADGRLFLASTHNDSVSAYDVVTGKYLWRFYANGPVRFAPVAHRSKLYFGSDDGYLYCLNAADGRELWRFRAVPSSRTVLGNRRVISVWPIRGGPVLAEDTLYFAAGVWPFEGVFVYALDAKTGKVKWLNDRTGHLYGVQPHDARSIGGLTPQGYLLVNGDELVVPCGAGRPATFNRHSGKLINFNPPRAGRKPGGWFAALNEADSKVSQTVRRGEVTYDSLVSGDRHEDRQVRGEGIKGLRSQIIAGERLFKFAKPPAGIEGEVHAMVAAQKMLFLSTVEGHLYALDASERKPITFTKPQQTLEPVNASIQAQARSMLKRAATTHGYALILGAADGQLIEALIAESQMHFLVIESDGELVARLRRRWDAAGLYGARVVIRHEAPPAFTPPPYFANLILCEAPALVGLAGKRHSLAKILNALRPFGGIAVLGGDPEVKPPSGAQITSVDQWTLVSRNGALPGSSNYHADWKGSPDELVGAPLGVLWYDDSIGHFKRSPQPLFVDGVMVSQAKDWSDLDQRPYPLKRPTYCDVYTGRRFAPGEPMLKGKTFALHDSKKKQPSVYRPSFLDNNGKLHGKRPDLGEMVNPLNGVREKRIFPKSYGCDGGIDYGHLITMRSGTAAFYDKRIESGTIHISGPRSGCSNSIIPANGLLNVPYYYQGCTCSYPLPVGLSMIRLPPAHEQWASFGAASTENIQRVGLNLGAPGDRMTESGTLWLDFPSIGGPSPNLRLMTEPASAKSYYNHALWIRGGRGWPWVASSGIQGMHSLKIEGLLAGMFTVRLTFAETAGAKPGERKFDVFIQGRKILDDFDPVVESGGDFRAYVHESQKIKVGENGVLEVRLEAEAGEPILSGVELGTKKLPLGMVPTLPDRNTE